MTENRKFGPDPSNPFPMEGNTRVCFLKNVIRLPNVEIGDYTYYEDFENPANFGKNILYHYPIFGDRLIIGKFCAIAHGVKFLMNGANHKMKTFTTYPFGLFGNGWEQGIPELKDLPFKGDTVIGNDVWIGLESLIMPGVHIGDGAIIGTRSVVTKDVPPYTIVGGDPAIPLKKRFDEKVIALLLELRWWNWDIKKITDNIGVLTGEDTVKLQDFLDHG